MAICKNQTPVVYPLGEIRVLKIPTAAWKHCLIGLTFGKIEMECIKNCIYVPVNSKSHVNSKKHTCVVKKFLSEGKMLGRNY